jgi:DNA polymerase III subunit delta'
MARLSDRLIGHKNTLATLIEAQAADRLASTLLFSGPAGIGKRLVALALAQALVCERRDPSGCGICGSCLRLEKEQSESLMVVSPDGAAIKIEQARDILQFIALQKLGRSRVVVIDQAHLLNPQAANALLKSLEEPPIGTHFILLTHLAAAVLPTIRSRSQMVRFAPLSKDELNQILGASVDPWILESAQGSVEKAHRLMEAREDYQELETAAQKYLLRAADAFPFDEISHLRELMKDKNAQSHFAMLLQNAFRGALRLQAGLTSTLAQNWEACTRQAATISSPKLAELAEATLVFEQDLLRNVDRGLLLENFAINYKNYKNFSGPEGGQFSSATERAER